MTRSDLSSRLAALGAVPLPNLIEARLALHFAAQPVAAFGVTVVPAEDDFGHTALRWSDPAEALCSRVHEGTGLDVGLHPVDFSLRLRRKGQELERLPLDGRTLDEAYAWLGDALTRAGLRPDSPDGRVVRPSHADQMPDHPVGRGARWEAPPEPARRELAAWLAAADALMEAVTRAIPRVGPIRCWPHHFDTAVLHVLEGEGESMRSVGVGLSPGDGDYDEPYVYVNPWPKPEGAPLPALPAGHWHTEGWTGAVLRGQALVRLAGDARATTVMEMIEQAHRALAARLMKQGAQA